MKPIRPHRIAIFFLIVLLGSRLRLYADNSQAYAALQHGHVDEAQSLLRAAIAAHPANPEAHQLLCRAAYAEEEADTAIDECRQAIAQAPNDSDDQMWLGRALGLKAAHANPITAITLARQVLPAFERAVQLNPANVYAASDLGEFYVNAPSFLGGSPDKAKQLAAALQGRSPQRAHRLLGLLAEKNGYLIAAEAEFKAAIDAGHTPEAYTNLALFYEHEKMFDRLLPAISAALDADRRHGPVQVDAASILISAHRGQPIAMQALRAYLRSDAQTDEAPVFRAHVLLGNLLAKNKDKDGARREYNAALALAAHYTPARKALDNL
jgi:tetratricopeptide (TPR) repeat protein